MAKSTDERPIPNLEIYNFEGELESAYTAAFKSLVPGPQAAPQNGTENLVTPRIECKFISGQQEQRSYIVPNTNPPWTYQNMWVGTLMVKIVTNRVKEKSARQHHNYCRGVCRWISQDHINQLTARMKFLTIIQVLESGTSPSFDQTSEEEISALAYNIKFNLRPSAFPQPTA